MIAAGVNAKALSPYLGHSTITMTLDRYGHLMPAHDGEAAAMLTRYLARHVEQDRLGGANPSSGR
jgi:integrase